MSEKVAMGNDRISKIRREMILHKITRRSLPCRFLEITKELNFSDLEKVLSNSVMTIELSVRPSYLRCPEFIFASISAVLSVMLGLKLRNYTIGKFQIGILTSLQWTHTKKTPSNYVRRMLCLLATKGSYRIFRIGVWVFLKEYKFRSDGLLECFAEFYNGTPKNVYGLIPYHEVLKLLVSKDQMWFESFQSNRQINNEQISFVQMNLPTTMLDRHFFEAVDEVVELRLEKIRRIIKCGDRLCTVLIICSKTPSQVVYYAFYGEKTGRVPVLQDARTVGSTLKIALYSAFLENSLVSASTEYEDHPLVINWGNKVLNPKNADGRFRGKVTLEYAFANSINIIALKIIQELGVEEFSKYLRKCGINCPLPNTPLLALGPIKLTGWELLATLSPILHNGHLVYLCNGEEQIYASRNNGERIISTTTAEIMKRLLNATVVNGTGRYLKDRFPYAKGGKTGTSENNRDLWFVGLINDNLYGLVWLGRQDEQSIEASDNYPPSASRFAVPLWSDLLGFDWNEFA